jgi:LysR family nod box-dependent transcriptional activator
MPLTADEYLAAHHVIVRWASGRIETLDTRGIRAAKLHRQADVTVASFTLMPQFVLGTQRVTPLPRPLAEQLAAHWPVPVQPCPVPIAPLLGRIQWQRHQDQDPAILGCANGCA